MLDKEHTDKELEFVATHYRSDAFNASRAWTRLHIVVRPWWMRPRGVAAAVAALALAATAGIYTWIIPHNSGSTVDIESSRPVENTPPVPVSVTARIEFGDESLTVVVKEIERVYGVSVANVPEGDYRVTLSYEGNADELVDTLNDLFGINMELRP